MLALKSVAGMEKREGRGVQVIKLMEWEEEGRKPM